MKYKEACLKYYEYKKKLNSWVQLFEEEYGVAPTDEDMHASSTWMALNDKVSDALSLLAHATS